VIENPAAGCVPTGLCQSKGHWIGVSQSTKRDVREMAKA
jgi:hypothetical protein